MHNSDVSRVFLDRPISAGDLGEGTVMPPTKSSGKSLGGGPRSKAPGNYKNLVLQNHLLLIKIYPPQSVMKLIQHVFF